MPVVVALEEIMALIGEGAAATAESAATIDEMIAASETASEALVKSGTEATAKTAKSTSQWEQVMKVAKSKEAKSAWEFVKSTLDAAAIEEMMLNKVEAYTSHTAASREMVAELEDMAHTTMLGNGVYENATTLLKHGIGEGEIIKDLRQIADVGRGDAKSIQQLALAFSHVRENGKLMRKEYDEFKDAGFDPVKEMVAHWEQFGFKVKVTEHDLLSMMEKGKIGADKISKAFEVATSNVGSFHNGLAKMERGTSAGLDKLLESNWDAFKTNIGNKILPVKKEAEEIGVWALEAVNRAMSTAPSKKLTSEKQEINDLVGSVTKLNDDDEGRPAMVEMLKTKYPGQFGSNISEKTTNSEFSKLLTTVNESYDKQIKISEHKEYATTQHEDLDKLTQLVARARADADLLKQGKKAKYLTAKDSIAITGTGLVNPFKYIGDDQGYLEAFVRNAQESLSTKRYNTKAADSYVVLDNKKAENESVISRVNELIKYPEKRKELWGMDAGANYKLLLKEAHRYDDMSKASGGYYDDNLMKYDYSKFYALFNWQKKTAAATGGAGAETAAAITGGGRKVININLNQPLVGKQEFHVGSMKEALEIGLNEFREKYLRVLQGAVASL